MIFDLQFFLKSYWDYTYIFPSVEETDDSLCKDKETHVSGTPQADIDVRGLKDEVQF